MSTVGENRQTELRRLSRLAHQGTQIRVHRSLDTLRMHRSIWLTVLLLPPAMTAAFVASYDSLLVIWEWVLQFGVERLRIAGSVARDAVPLIWFSLAVPSVQMASWVPDAVVLWSTLAVVVAVVAATLFMPDWALPVAYVLRFVCLLLLLSVAVFWAWPAVLPYTAQQHVRDCFALGTAIIALTPWIHALTYYIFDFGIARKIALTAITMLFMLAYLPVKMLIHAYVLDQLSLLFMPVLFLVLGVAMDVFVLIAIYSWGMSWRPADE